VTTIAVPNIELIGDSSVIGQHASSATEEAQRSINLSYVQLPALVCAKFSQIIQVDEKGVLSNRLRTTLPGDEITQRHLEYVKDQSTHQAVLRTALLKDHLHRWTYTARPMYGE